MLQSHDGLNRLLQGRYFPCHTDQMDRSVVEKAVLVAHSGPIIHYKGKKCYHPHIIYLFLKFEFFGFFCFDLIILLQPAAKNNCSLPSSYPFHEFCSNLVKTGSTKGSSKSWLITLFSIQNFIYILYQSPIKFPF